MHNVSALAVHPQAVRPYGVLPSTTTAAAVRDLIEALGVAGAARALTLSREGTVRLGAGVRVTRGTLFVAEARLRELADVTEVRHG